MNDPDFLVIGHITKDLQDEGFTIGGTATYSALTARNLGRRTGIITSIAPDFAVSDALRDVEIVIVPSPVTTTFQNIYLQGTRRQFVHAVAERIGVDRVPLTWRRTPIVHLGPVAQELDGQLVRLFTHLLIGVTPQGWLRRWDEDGLVFFEAWAEAEELLPSVDVLIFSEEDVAGDADLVRAYAQLAKIAVVTQGADGATLYHRGQRRHFPAFEAVEVDPTGAGDVFAAAYLIRLEETGDPYEATNFANCVASFSVEGVGVSAIPTRQQVERRLRDVRL